MLEPTSRFSSRVENYVKYRPSYPREVIDLLVRECELGPQTRVADIGSGTGIFSKLLLETGATVCGVEPNEAMRKAGETFLKGYSNFRSYAGTAEDTGLEADSIGLITAAQAFHWFDRASTRREWSRILVPNGKCALVWNDRVTERTPFLVGYEELLRKHLPEYLEVGHKNQREVVLEFLGTKGQLAIFPNTQFLDEESLIGRVLSSSYAPELGDPRHEPMMRDLRNLFHATENEGTVEFLYNTEVFYGPLN